MIVECQNCTTRFQLDDARIPLAGIRVRCSKCKEAFFLEHPSATRAQAVEELAFGAIANETAPAPDATQDLLTPSSSAAFEDDEDDWEFNHEEPQDPATSMSRGTPAGRDSFTPSAESSSIELAASPKAAQASAPVNAQGGTPTARRATHNEVSFDESDTEMADIDIEGVDVEGLGGGESVFDHEAIGDLGGAAHPDGSFGDSGAHAHTEGRGISADLASHGKSPAAFNAPTALPSSLQNAPDLGEPEDWDLLGEDAPAPPVQKKAREPRAKSAIGAIALTRMSSPHTAAPAASVPDSLLNSSAPHRFAGGLRRVGAGAGWLLTLSLLAATLWQGVTRSVATAYSPALTQFEVGPLVARSIETAWISTREGQTLLAVRGQLHNPTSSPLKPELALMVSLLDENGVPLGIPSLEAGRTIEAETLRDLEATTREQLVIDASAMLAAVTLGGGSSVEFAAYFSDVPARARRISVQGVEPEVTYDAGQDLIWGTPTSDEVQTGEGSVPAVLDDTSGA